MDTFIVGIFAAIIVGATAAFGYVVYVDHSGRTARKRRLTETRSCPPTVSERLSVYDPKEPCRGHRKLRYQVYGFLRYRVLASR